MSQVNDSPPRKSKEYEEGYMDGRDARALEIALRLKRECVPNDVIYRATGIDANRLQK